MSRADLLYLTISCMVAVAMFVWLLDWLADWWEERSASRSLPGNLGQRVLVGFDGARDRSVVVTDTRGFELGMRRAAAAMERMRAWFQTAAEQVGRYVTGWMRRFELRRESKLAGLGARFYVRGGLECRSVEDVTEHVRRVLTVNPQALALLAESPELAISPPTRREVCELAVEVMKGYVLHMDDRIMGPLDPELVPTHPTWVRQYHWWPRGHVFTENLFTGRTYTGWTKLTPALPAPTKGGTTP